MEDFEGLDEVVKSVSVPNDSREGLRLPTGQGTLTSLRTGQRGGGGSGRRGEGGNV